MKRLFLVYISLVTLTLSGTFISKIHPEKVWIPVVIIMALLCVKFIMVVLEYMEMRKANRAWKLGVILPAMLTAVIVGVFAVV